MARIGTNMNVQVQSTLATSAITITALTLADPGVATASGHGLSDGDILVASVSAGMVELDGQAIRVASSATNTFELQGIDTSDYTAWTAGTATEVTAFETIAGAQSVSMPDPAPNKIDITRLIDKSKQNAFGLPEAPDGTILGLYDPQNTGVGLVRSATKANSTLVVQINWAGGELTVANANVSGGQGFELAQNDAAKSTIAFTPVGDVLDFAS